jgi:hypothetical protein
MKLKFILKYLGEPNNYGGDSGYIGEKCISSLDLKRNYLNDEHRQINVYLKESAPAVISITCISKVFASLY